jgi:hypothetical protein
MMTAHVNNQGIVLRFDAADNLPNQQWEILLDQLKSEHIPSLYANGRRSHVSIEPGTGKTRMVIYFTTSTVTVDQAKDILHHWGIDVHNAAEEQARESVTP